MFRLKVDTPTDKGVNEDKTAAKPEVARRSTETRTNSGMSQSASPSARTSEQAARRLIVGQGIRLSGEIKACERLVVEGDAEIILEDAVALEIAESGTMNGNAKVEYAEVYGLYEGNLTVRGRLTIYSTGRVRGSIQYGELEVERGGQIFGQISEISEADWSKDESIDSLDESRSFIPERFQATVYLNNASEDDLEELQAASQEFLRFLGYRSDS